MGACASRLEQTWRSLRHSPSLAPRLAKCLASASTLERNLRRRRRASVQAAGSVNQARTGSQVIIALCALNDRIIANFSVVRQARSLLSATACGLMTNPA